MHAKVVECASVVAESVLENPIFGMQYMLGAINAKWTFSGLDLKRLIH